MVWSEADLTKQIFKAANAPPNFSYASRDYQIKFLSFMLIARYFAVFIFLNLQQTKFVNLQVTTAHLRIESEMKCLNLSMKVIRKLNY